MNRSENNNIVKKESMKGINSGNRANSLRWRLIGGFIICALLTAFSGGAGIVSLQQIRNNMRDTNTGISSEIDNQGSTTMKLMTLRYILSSILYTKSQQQLDLVDKQIKEYASFSKNNEQDVKLPDHKILKQLANHKSQELTTQIELNDLGVSTEQSLDKITKQVMTIVDATESNSVTQIKTASTALKDNLNMGTTTNNSALTTTKAALSVQVLSYKINIIAKDILLSYDEAFVSYSQNNLNVTFEKITESVSALPENETVTKIVETIETLKNTLKQLIAAKKEILQEDETNDQIGKIRLESEKLINEIIQLVSAVADDTEFETILKTEEVSESIMQDFEKMSTTTTDSFATIRAALTLRALLNELSVLIKEALFSADNHVVDDVTNEFNKLVSRVEQEIGKLPQNDSTSQILNPINELKKSVGLMLDKKKQLLVVLDRLQGSIETVQKQISAVDNVTLETVKGMTANINDTLSQTSEIVNKWQYAQLGFVLVAFVLAVLIGLFVSGLITKPLNNAVYMLKDIADGEGDLTARLHAKSKDEIGALAKWFNAFVGSVQSMMGKIADNSSDLDKAASSVFNLSNTISDEAKETSRKSSLVADSAKDMSSNMNMAAESMEQATSSINTITSSVEEIKHTINEIADNSDSARNITKDAVTHTQSASEQVEKLGSAASEIGEVIQTITDISDQVNLLALNATIEAARAGESGKGFAVVANEIKELAKQTAEATGEIKTRIQGIQDSTDGTVNQIRKISSVVRNVDEIVDKIASAVEEQTVTTNEIADSAAQASSVIDQVNSSVGESNNTAFEISDGIRSVTLSATNMASSSSQLATDSENLSQLSDRLKQLIGRFII